QIPPGQHDQDEICGAERERDEPRQDASAIYRSPRHAKNGNDDEGCGRGEANPGSVAWLERDAVRAPILERETERRDEDRDPGRELESREGDSRRSERAGNER